MRRPVCWTEKLPDGVRREVRVHFLGRGKIRWQSKRTDQEKWEYDFAPTQADWEALETRMENRYRRRNVPWRELESVRKQRPRATGEDETA